MHNSERGKTICRIAYEYLIVGRIILNIHDASEKHESSSQAVIIQSEYEPIIDKYAKKWDRNLHISQYLGILAVKKAKQAAL